MANDLTALLGKLFTAVDVVSREVTGMLPSVSVNGEVTRAALNQAVNVPYTDALAGENITAAMTVPTPGDETTGNRTVTMTKARAVPFKLTGEDTQGANTGATAGWLVENQIAQAVRTLVNEMEADLTALYAKFSRAYGTAGTTPFASSLIDFAGIRQILTDNGAPIMGGWRGVINTTAGAKMRTLTQLTKANEAGETSMLRQGVLTDVFGGMVRESAQIGLHTAGTAASATTDATGYAVGATVITLAATGTGTILAGDVITFAGDLNKYVVASGDADVSDGGTITLALPGLRKAIPAAATAITVLKDGTSLDYTPNMAFTPNAIVLAVRPPALPPQGDIAIDRQMVVDPRSGIPFEFAIYPGYRMVRYEVSAVWGVEVVKPEHTALLLG